MGHTTESYAEDLFDEQALASDIQGHITHEENQGAALLAYFIGTFVNDVNQYVIGLMNQTVGAQRDAVLRTLKKTTEIVQSLREIHEGKASRFKANKVFQDLNNDFPILLQKWWGEKHTNPFSSLADAQMEAEHKDRSDTMHTGYHFKRAIMAMENALRYLHCYASEIVSPVSLWAAHSHIAAQIRKEIPGTVMTGGPVYMFPSGSRVVFNQPWSVAQLLGYLDRVANSTNTWAEWNQFHGEEVLTSSFADEDFSKEDEKYKAHQNITYITGMTPATYLMVLIVTWAHNPAVMHTHHPSMLEFDFDYAKEAHNLIRTLKSTDIRVLETYNPKTDGPEVVMEYAPPGRTWFNIDNPYGRPYDSPHHADTRRRLVQAARVPIVNVDPDASKFDITSETAPRSTGWEGIGSPPLTVMKMLVKAHPYHKAFLSACHAVRHTNHEGFFMNEVFSRNTEANAVRVPAGLIYHSSISGVAFPVSTHGSTNATRTSLSRALERQSTFIFHEPPKEADLSTREWRAMVPSETAKSNVVYHGVVNPHMRTAHQAQYTANENPLELLAGYTKA